VILEGIGEISRPYRNRTVASAIGCRAGFQDKQLAVAKIRPANQHDLVLMAAAALTYDKVLLMSGRTALSPVYSRDFQVRRKLIEGCKWRSVLIRLMLSDNQWERIAPECRATPVTPAGANVTTGSL
jgi:hypothetical protein